MFLVLFSQFWVLWASSNQLNFRLRFLPHRCASTNDVCKVRIPHFQTTHGQEQNYESVEPHFKTTNANFATTNRNFQTTIGGSRPGIFRLRMGQKSSYETEIHKGKEQPRNYESCGRTVCCVSLDRSFLLFLLLPL